MKKKKKIKPIVPIVARVARVDVYCNHEWDSSMDIPSWYSLIYKPRVCHRCGAKWHRNLNRGNGFIDEDQPRTIIGKLESQDEADKKGITFTWSNLNRNWPLP